MSQHDSQADDLQADELPKTFEPAKVEKEIYARWLEGGYFSPTAEQVRNGGDPYVVVMPLPNVTAVLHMGHGLNNTIQDVLTRWQRMRGRIALWVPGTDHAGIATQNVVERQLAAEGKTRYDLGREAFVERVWEHVDKTGDAILGQLRAIGFGCDWDRHRFTLDESPSAAVREVFVRLYEDGLIYRGEYIINWCPRCLTALSNEEAEGTEAEGSLWHLRYPIAPGFESEAAAAKAAGADAIGRLDDGRWYLTVSTTRPETALGDTGIAVSPDDPRYQPLLGAKVSVPFTDRLIPIVADDHVDPEFGTGLVKVTPAHDPNDFEISKRTGLDVLNVMTPEATMNDEVPEEFRGLDRIEARRLLLTKLKDTGLYAGRDNHSHSVPSCYRCQTVVEPRLSEQWFVKMEPLAKPALAASKDGTLTFTPDRWTKVYENWMEGIRDWCISRQLWWGHRIPVWYCGDCNEVMALREDPDACTACGGSNIEQDSDVLDTWFSSWLWPFSSLGWPNDKPEDVAAFFPGHTLVTAPEILFFWVSRMVMSGYYFHGELPFTEVYLHGTVRDIEGRKMSKSLGNGIDPLEIVDLYGADALRYTLISSAGIGADIRLDHNDVEAAFAPGRNFVNKLWNAGRFAMMSLGEGPVQPLDKITATLELEDRWLLSRYQFAIDRVTSELEGHRIHGSAEVLREFFWNEFADWYLEFVKDRLRGGSGEQSRQAARSTLVHVLDGICRLLHPMVPFITEELWGNLPIPEGTERAAALVIADWPTHGGLGRDEGAEAEFAWVQELIVQLRSLRKEYGVGEGQEVTIHLAASAERLACVDGQRDSLKRLAKVVSVETSRPAEGAVGGTMVLSDGAEVFLPLDGLIDLDQERARLTKAIDRLRGVIRGTEGRLANEGFLAKAPAEVVGKERSKVASMIEQVDKLQEKLTAMGGG